MADKFYLVELRCAGCGLIFVSSMLPVASHKVEEYSKMFEAKGPEKFVQCKNRCKRWKEGEPRPIEVPWRRPVNTNQKVVVTEIPEEELQARGLMR